MSRPCPTASPSPRPRLRLRQVRARGARPRAARGRGRAGLHRRLGGPDRDARPAGHQGRGPHRLPRVPRRPGQDPAPQGARRHPRRPPARLPRRRSSTSSAWSRSTWWSPTSTRSPQTVASGAAPDECVEQIDIGGPSMVRAAAKNHPSRRDRHLARAVRRRAGRGAGRGGFTLDQRQRLAAEAFVHTATYDVARRVAGWATCSPTPPRGLRLPGLGRRAPGTKATVLRYGENPHQAAALYTNGFEPSRVSPRPSSCTARRCPTTTTSTPTRRAGRRTTSTTRRGDHQARQPVRHRRSARTSPRPTARRTRATRSRRSAASSPPTGR